MRSLPSRTPENSRVAGAGVIASPYVTSMPMGNLIVPNSATRPMLHPPYSSSFAIGVCTVLSRLNETPARRTYKGKVSLSLAKSRAAFESGNLLPEGEVLKTFELFSTNSVMIRLKLGPSPFFS